MKCPKCGNKNAYQPLTRQLECPNMSCEFYVGPAPVPNKINESAFLNKQIIIPEGHAAPTLLTIDDGFIHTGSKSIKFSPNPTRNLYIKKIEWKEDAPNKQFTANFIINGSFATKAELSEAYEYMLKTFAWNKK